MSVLRPRAIVALIFFLMVASAFAPGLCGQATSAASDRAASVPEGPVSRLPDDLDLVIEVDRPKALWKALRRHPLIEGLGALDPKASPATNSELRDLYDLVEAFGPFLEEPGAFALRVKTTPRFVLVLGDRKGRGLMGLREILKQRLPDLVLGEIDADQDRFAIEGLGHVAAVPGSLLFSTHPILLRRMIRLEGPDSMAAHPEWRALEAKAQGAPLKILAPNRRLFEKLSGDADGRPDNFLAVLVFQSFLDDLSRARSARAWGDIADVTGLQIQMKAARPVAKGWRHPAGKAALVPAGEETILRLRLDRDLAGFWAARLEDVPEAGRQELAEFTQAMNVFFAGISFDEALAQVSPGLELLVENNEFLHDENPEIVLPAFALVLRHQMDANMRDRFRVAFQTAIGIINADAGQKGRQPMLQFSRRVGEVEALGARFLPDPRDGRTAIQYNFTPAIAFVRDRLIISSSMSLTEGLLARFEAAEAREGRPQRGDLLHLDGPALQGVLAANRLFFTDQAVLEEGLDEDEAEARTKALLELAGRLRGLELRRLAVDAGATWEIRIETKGATPGEGARR
jgi:hypothetical protein